MVWMLSIGIMLNIEQKHFLKLVKCVQNDDPKDYLIDFLIGCRVKNWSLHNNSKFSKPYKVLSVVIDLATKNKDQALKYLISYIQKDWYKGH